MKVALLYNAKPENADGATDDAYEEYDHPATISAIRDALCGLGLTVVSMEADRRMPARLEEEGCQFVFNIAEGRGGRCREALVPAVCELLELPYTGSDALTMAATLDKFVARRLVSPEVPVARAVLLDGQEAEDELARLCYPAIVKPNDEGSSKGIRENAVVESAAAARERALGLHEAYGCPVLVEEFLPGTEVTVGIVGNGPSTEVLGVMEIAPGEADARFVYSIEVKRDWRRRVGYHVPPRVPSQTLERITCQALQAYRILGCRDFARMDFRLDAAGRACFLECNPLPGLDPDNSDLVILARSRLTHAELVQRIFLEAARRCEVQVR